MRRVNPSLGALRNASDQADYFHWQYIIVAVVIIGGVFLFNEWMNGGLK